MKPEDNLTVQIEFIRDELTRTQSRIQNYDDLIFKIKGWTITLWVATIGLAATQKQPYVAFAVLPVIVAFWGLEAQRKEYQQRHIVRMRYIERFVNGTADDPYPTLAKATADGDLGDFAVVDPVGLVAYDRDESFRKEYDKHFRLWKSGDAIRISC
jgi:hypothetical protein